MINALIHYVHDMGWGKTVYDSAFLFMIISSFCFLLQHRDKYGLSKKQVVIFLSCIIPLTLVLSVTLAWIASGFEIFGPSDLIRTFVFIPLLCLPIAKLISLPKGIMLDTITPCVLIWHIWGHNLCPFLGCCAGVSCRWGIWNPILNERVFPIQWLTCLVTFGILMMILRYEKKHEYDGRGKTYPIFLVCYGTARFFLEFLKHGDVFWGGISRMAIHAILMVVVGTVWLFTIEEIERENNRKVERNRQKRRTYSPQRGNIEYPKEDKI